MEGTVQIAKITICFENYREVVRVPQSNTAESNNIRLRLKSYEHCMVKCFPIFISGICYSMYLANDIRDG